MNIDQAAQYMYAGKQAEESWEHTEQVGVPEHFQITVEYNSESGPEIANPGRMLNQMVAIFDQHTQEN